MKIGTKSVLFGYHCWFIHPWFVAWGWWKLYGFPWDPRLWVCFFVHDLGYWGKPNMDGEEGERHVLWGAEFVEKLFDPPAPRKWFHLCLYHSRYWAKKHNTQPSRLCFADKLAFLLYPEWLCFTLYWLTGEWKEYAIAHRHEVFPKDADGGPMPLGMREWFYPTREYMANWIKEFVSGDKEDTWTKAKPSN